MVGGSIDTVKAYFQVKVKVKAKEEQQEKDIPSQSLIIVKTGQA